jgi:hypothetical protein
MKGKAIRISMDKGEKIQLIVAFKAAKLTDTRPAPETTMSRGYGVALIWHS